MKLNDINLFEIHSAGARLAHEPTHALPAHYYCDPARSVKLMGEAMQREFDEVEDLLNFWSEWMHVPDRLAESFPPESAVFITSWRKDSEDEEHAAHAVRIERINAAFDSLLPRYKDAIMRHYSLGRGVWKFAQPATFDEAKIMIRVKFILKGVL